MSTTVSLVKRTKVRADGTYPLAIRLTKNRISRFVHLGKSLQPQHWNRSYPWVKNGHPNSQHLNHFLLDKLNSATREVLRIETTTANVAVDYLKDAVKYSLEGRCIDQVIKEEKEKRKPTVFEFAAEYLRAIEESGDYDRYRSENAPVLNLKRFAKTKKLYFEDLTVKYLKGFKTYLKTTRKVGERTAVNNLIIIRTLFKQAIEEEIIPAKSYPFGRGKITCKRPNSLKVGLEENELMLVENIELEEEHIAYHPRNLWLISFYFAGMRASDVLKLRWDRLKNGRLYYAMGKNLKGDSFKIPEKAFEILDIYRTKETKPSDLVFPYLIDPVDFTDKKTLQIACHRELQKIGRGLKELETLLSLEKSLTMHVARHSFATIAGDKIPMPKLQRLFRHSCITTTINYMSAFMYQDMDNALDRVVNFDIKPGSPEYQLRVV